MTIDPIHQFAIHDIAPLFTIGGRHFAFTNSALYMLIIVVAASALLIGATIPRAMVPGRLQSVAEMSYEFVANTVRSSAGNEGMKFFPFVFTLFDVRAVRQHDRPDPVFVYRDQPAGSSRRRWRCWCSSSS